ncbi:peptide MFS transporter [Cnuibacter sp. UC19_7]|uniref:peptide MFS transporter n=1 Tax=Cnuibacter sp. UC19_7 TaxID=3350166 RepID=UPI0036720FF7
MTTSTPDAGAPVRRERTFFGQPWSLVHIFGVEMWERFSYYGMQAVLAFYLVYSVSEGGLGLPQTTGASILGAYGGAVYLATVLGAWLADRILGSERVLFYSAIVVMLGHIALAVLPGFSGVIVGLLLIAVGSGGIKANSTAIVGTLYEEKDPNRDAGFSLFYLGINLGAFLGPLLTGALQTSLGFHYAFGAAALGMAIGLTQYAIGRRSLPDTAREVPNPLGLRGRLLMLGIAVVTVIVVVALVLLGVLNDGTIALAVVVVTAAAAIAYFIVILTSSRTDHTERRRVLSFIPMFLTSVAFWALYQQQFTVIPFYADNQTDLDVFGFDVPPAWVQSINPIFIIILSGVFAAIWTKLGDRQPATPYKFGAAVVIMGVAFLLFLPFANSGQNGTPLLALAGILLVFTVAELLLSPVGLSLSTKLAPRAFRTQMVALFYLSVALGTALSGQLATFYGTGTPGEQVPYFGISGIVAIAVGVALIIATPWVRKLMSGVK